MVDHQLATGDALHSTSGLSQPLNADEKLIAKAAGGEHAVRWVRGNRTQITLSIAPELLRQVDAIAQRRHLSRAALLQCGLVRRCSRRRPLDGQLRENRRHRRGKGRQGRERSVRGRLEAIDAILRDASSHDVLTLRARALTGVVPNCCGAHQHEFEAEFLRVLSECVAIWPEQDEAEAGEDDAHPQVH